MKDNSIKKDIGLVVIGIVLFYVILAFAKWADKTFDLSNAYTVVDLMSTVLKVVTASSLAWVLKRLAFSQTLGKDFGDTFNEGWNQMTLVEKSRWIIITFLVVFASVMFVA